ALKESEKREVLERIAENEFEILVTTDRFIVNRFEILKDKSFDFIFVDDIDSFLKSPRNIDKILSILGFNDEIIALAFQLLDLRTEANRMARMGKDATDILRKIEKIRNEIEYYKSRNKVGLLVVSGATVRARRTKRIKLFEELLGFQIGFKPEFLRNIKDFYLKKEAETERHVLDLIKKFGGGCLVFVPSAIGREYAVKLSDFLNENGIRAYVYRKMDEKILEDFRNGNYDALVGVASFRSPLARGIDIPERIRYVIFAGVPRMEIPLSWEEYNPTKILTLLKNIREFLEQKHQDKAGEIIARLRRIVPLSKEIQEKIKEAIENGTMLEGFEEFARKIVFDARSFLKEVITPQMIQRIMESREISIKRKDDTFYLIVADPVAYIQASGRASRMFAGGITRGASFLIVDDEKAFYSLQQRLKFMLADVSWSKFKPETVKKWFEKIDEDRKIIREIREGKVVKRIKDYIKTALLIVESPTKARTISRFFGRPYKRKIGDLTIFEVSIGKYILNIAASMGHIYDLVITEGFHGVKVEDGKFTPIYDFIKKCKKCGEQFTEFSACPKCKSTEFYSKEEFIKALRMLSLEVNHIFIATDPDTEGEKIAYDIYCSLYPVNNKIERLEFHEITKKAFLKAINNRRKIDFKLVEAQIVRRIEDRWIGFELSQKLWRRFRNYRLSAGRVQTPVLGWIIERVNEARKKKTILSAKLANGLKVSIENPNLPFPAEELQKRLKELKAKIEGLTSEEKTIHPPPPYTTDTLLRDASAKLNFSASKTMMLAQDLFEMGLCTYHRTDSTTVSTVGVSLAKDYIQEKYPTLFVPRRYPKEGAHECIRPTRALDAERLKNMISLGLLRFPKRLAREHFQLYDLIFKRFMASQMREVKVLYQKFNVLIDGNQVSIENPVKVVSEGFNKVLPVRLENPVEEGEYAIEFARILRLPAARLFSQGEVIALMREKAIGRPSTYAKIISTLLERKYVIERKNRLISTRLGFKVYMYLRERFGNYVSEETTRRLESQMDSVEQGRADYQQILNELYREILEIKEI
ncbi:reverse gyrase, partial [Candidatus Bathyarchaeota archaeon]|nr:reverse gyrase [Candidatus Bathyarchaeota archaeon]